MKTIKYDHFGRGSNWDDLNDVPEQRCKVRHVLGVACTASIDKHHMVMFYYEDPKAKQIQFFTDFDDEITAEENEGQNLIPSLNKHFMPHELTNITIYEESHPNDKGLSTSITHTSAPGADPDARDFPDEISKRTKQETPVNPNYRYQLFENTAAYGETRHDLWKRTHNEALEYMRKLDDSGFKVASFNRTKDKNTGAVTDDACVVVISWDRNAEQNIVDMMRPQGCIDQCIIF